MWLMATILGRAGPGLSSLLHPALLTHSCTLTDRKQAALCALLLSLLLALRPVRLFLVLLGVQHKAFSRLVFSVDHSVFYQASVFF